MAKLLRRSYMARGRAISIVRQVLIYLYDQRCRACAGHRYLLEGAAIRACATCNATGFALDYPPKWGRDHQGVMRDCLEAMSRALHQARRGFSDD